MKKKRVSFPKRQKTSLSFIPTLVLAVWMWRNKTSSSSSLWIFLEWRRRIFTLIAMMSILQSSAKERMKWRRRTRRPITATLRDPLDPSRDPSNCLITLISIISMPNTRMVYCMWLFPRLFFLLKRARRFLWIK